MEMGVFPWHTLPLQFTSGLSCPCVLAGQEDVEQQVWAYFGYLCLENTCPRLWPVGASPTFHGITHHMCFPFSHRRASLGPFPWLQHKVRVEGRREVEWLGASPARFSSWAWFWPPVICSEVWRYGCKRVCLHPVPYGESYFVARMGTSRYRAGGTGTLFIAHVWAFVSTWEMYSCATLALLIWNLLFKAVGIWDVFWVILTTPLE